MKLLVLIFLILTSSDFLKAQSDTEVTEELDARIKAADRHKRNTLGMHLDCHRRQKKYNCPAVKNSVHPDKRHLFLQCNEEPFNWKQCGNHFVLGGLSGAATFSATRIVVASIGTAGLATVLSTAGVATAGFMALDYLTYQEQQCYENIAYKKMLLKPLGYLHGADYAKSLEHLSCIDLEKKNRLAIRQLQTSIFQTEKNRKGLEEAMARDPSNTRRREHLKRMYFKKTELTKGEKAFLSYVKTEYEWEERYHISYLQLLKNYPCVNERLVAEYMCSTPGFTLGGFSSFLIRKTGRVTASVLMKRDLSPEAEAKRELEVTVPEFNSPDTNSPSRPDTGKIPSSPIILKRNNSLHKGSN